jgi:hypothetical protein
MNTLPRLRLLSTIAALAGLTACNGDEVKAHAGANAGEMTVGVVTVKSMTMSRGLTLSSELVPFQEIEVYAKESGYDPKTVHNTL